MKSVYLLLERYNLSIRHASHIGQKLSLNAKNDYYSFLYETVKYRKIYNINDNFDLIINCDETPLFFEMVDKTTIKKGEKNIIITTKGSKKKHITCLLAITASGKKLKPLLIFKGLDNGLIEKKLNSIKVVKNKDTEKPVFIFPS